MPSSIQPKTVLPLTRGWLAMLIANARSLTGPIILDGCLYGLKGCRRPREISSALLRLW
jgi:hypothetical protein